MDVLSTDRVVLSVMGPHAGESTAAIFSRKAADITAGGSTLWLCRSPQARPDRTQHFRPNFVLFLEASSKNGARPTTTEERATMLSMDGTKWSTLPAHIGPVTGRISSAYAFVLSELTTFTQPPLVDLWNYVDENGDAVRFRLGASTLLAQRSAPNAGMKSRYRRVLAVGKLAEPYAVWLR